MSLTMVDPLLMKSPRYHQLTAGAGVEVTVHTRLMFLPCNKYLIYIYQNLNSSKVNEELKLETQ